MNSISDFLNDDMCRVVEKVVIRFINAAHHLSRELETNIKVLVDSMSQWYKNPCTKVKTVVWIAGERVVVVTHGGVIRSLHKRATPRGQSAGKILNTSVNVFHLSDGDEWIIEAWGDVSHLNQMGFLKSGFGGDATSG